MSIDNWSSIDSFESPVSPIARPSRSQTQKEAPRGVAASQTETDEESGRPLHRIAEVRRRQGVSVRTASRRLKMPATAIQRQEDACCDLSLSELYRWQEALQVPINELLMENDGPLSEPILLRAKLLRAMKTVQSIAEQADDKPTQRLASMLSEQLVDIMPELRDVAPWHSVGQRRTQQDLGRAAERTIPDAFFAE